MRVRDFLRPLRTLAMLIAISSSHGAGAMDFGSGALPLRYVPAMPFMLEADQQVRIVGEVHSFAPVVIVLRVDDGASHGYSSRFNEERTVPPGHFEWTVPAGGMMTPSGRVLQPHDLRGVYLFSAGSSAARVTVTQFVSVPVQRLPAGSTGYALGRSDAPLPPGFERIAPGDARLRGANLTAIRRPSPDPLVASGIRGVESINLPWSKPRARVTIWSEDSGEWELLPAVLNQRVRVNGRDVSILSRTVEDWVRERYLSGSAIEHLASDDAWSAYGSRRGGAVTAVVDTHNDAVTIELAGPSAQSLFVNAILIEPEASTAGYQQVNSWRQSWYRQTWPIVASRDAGSFQAVDVTFPRDAAVESAPLVTRTAAAGTGVRIRIRVSSEVAVGTPYVAIDAPKLGGQSASARLWAGQWRLERRRANDTSLVLADNMLAGDVDRLPLLPVMARTYEVWVDIPRDARAGHWSGTFSIGQGEQLVKVPLTIDVLPLNLPPAAKPAGFYLDEAPHLTWFAELRGQRRQQIACDLDLMRSFGIDGSAPALATPSPANNDFEVDMHLARSGGVAAPWLAYAPAKRMAAQYGLRGSAMKLAGLADAITKGGGVSPVWSVADEPSNPGHSPLNVFDWLKELRAVSPTLLLAAQLNSPSDIRYANLFDVALVNDGYGLELPVLEKVRRVVKDLWLYNTARHRATAGLWLWLSPASRYVQWHARMPTADPFDPTDGREGDVQVIFPSLEACPAKPSIHRDLLEMAEGVVDQRWLAWLSAQEGADAEHLREAIRSRFGSWEKVRGLGGDELTAIRESIIEIAKTRGGR